MGLPLKEYRINSQLVSQPLTIIVTQDKNLLLQNPQLLLSKLEGPKAIWKDEKISMQQAKLHHWNYLYKWFSLLKILQYNLSMNFLLHDINDTVTIYDNLLINDNSVQKQSLINKVTDVKKDYNLLNHQIYPRNYVMLDLETTGLSILTDKIIQIAIIKVQNNEIVDKFNQLINPEKEIPEQSTGLTNISNQDVQFKPIFKDVIPQINNFLGDLPILGHNIQRFDLKMLNSEYTKARQKFNQHYYLDTLPLAKKVLPGRKTYKLESLKQLVNKEITDLTSHNAYNDIIINKAVYDYLIQN